MSKATDTIRQAIAENAEEFTKALLKAWLNECDLNRECGECDMIGLCNLPIVSERQKTIEKVAPILAERALKIWEGK